MAEKQQFKGKVITRKGRCIVSADKVSCPKCGHDRAWEKFGHYVAGKFCTRCGYKY